MRMGLSHVIACIGVSACVLACGDDGSDGGEGGQGGASSGGTSSGGTSSGGTGGSMGGDTGQSSCSDGEQNQDETDVDCGGSECPACEEGDACDSASDCASEVCASDVCAPAECGDGVTNADEDCDSEGEDSTTCNADCSAAACGDGYVNEEAGEVCEPTADAGPWDRCNDGCLFGGGLDGTWSTTNLPSTDSPWETLATATDVNDNLAGLQSFHYSGQEYLYDFTANYRYSIEDDEWVALEVALPFDVEYWENGAVDATSIWVPRGGSMHRFVLATETWEEAATDIPDGSTEATAAVFDGAGFIWYLGGGDTLVRFNTATDAVMEYSYADEFPEYDVYEARVAYDPITNSIAFTGYSNDTFLIFDIEAEEFTQGSANPGGSVQDNSCQDRAGGIYVGSDEDPTKMYRYDIGQDEFTELPVLPVAHDNNSSCVVSQDGYLYYATSENVDGEFFRLRLNVQ